MCKVPALAKGSIFSSGLLVFILLSLLVSPSTSSVSAMGLSDRADVMKDQVVGSQEKEDHTRMDASTFVLPSGICIGICSPVLPKPSSQTDIIYTAWGQDADTSLTSGIFLKRDGADFDPSTVRVDPGLGKRDPALAVSDSTVHIV